MPAKIALLGKSSKGLIKKTHKLPAVGKSQGRKVSLDTGYDSKKSQSKEDAYSQSMSSDRE